MRNRVLAYSTIVVLLLFALGALGGVLDPTEGPDQPQWWPGVCFVVLPVALAVRGAFTGVIVAGSEVVLRGWLRTRRVPRSQVRGVTTMKYSGAWNRGGESRVFRMLAIKTVDGTIEVPAVAARKAKAERLASALDQALSLHD